ncbi:MAG TPA: glycoside hydrolase family 3 N-terminal domain-containing protein [Gaiellaceae bacterium]|nr:glycoside hydrolase family 3 N-terminal domain-containing protein [Gaiellaceae bacterium]
MSGEVERQAAACLLASFPGPRAPEWILRWVESGLGGIVLFAGNLEDREQVAGLTATLRAERADLVIAIDEEGGDVTRLEAATGSSYPGNLALGFVDDVELTRAVAGAIAGDLVEAGVTLNLAPVADVNSNPQNPVIGVRSFGSEPELVARHVTAFVAATQARGVAACAKHFPGHGDTSVDSHLGLPVVEVEREELLAGPLVPFRAAVEAGVAAVMTAHLVVPALEGIPATVSEVVVGDLLRGELGFGGTVISDALDMNAVSTTIGVDETAVRAISAGVDALCLGPTIDAHGVESIHRALMARVPEERLAEAADNGRRLGRSAGHVRGQTPDIAEAAVAEVGADAARRALLISGDVTLDEPPLVIELAPEPLVAAGPATFGLGRAIVERRAEATVFAVHEPPSDAGAVLRSAKARPLVLVLRDAARHPWQQSAANDLIDLRPDAVVVETGLPAWLPPGASASVATHGAGRVNLEAAADVIVGPVRPPL